MYRFALVLVFSLSATMASFAQLVRDGVQIYGNEWIDYSNTYYKIAIAEDGIYQVTYEDLIQAGIAHSELTGADLRLFHHGEQIPIYTTSESSWNTEDYLLFRGLKNRGALDSLLYPSGYNGNLNPHYSSYTDTAAYFLALKGENAPLRISTQIEGTDLDLPDRNWYFHEHLLEYHDVYIQPHVNPGGANRIYNSIFEKGSGYVSKVNNEFNWSFPLKNPADNSTSPSKLELSFTSDVGAHQLSVDINQKPFLRDSAFLNFKHFRIQNSIPITELGDTIKLGIKGNLSHLDRYFVGYVSLTYPRMLKFSADDNIPNFLDLGASDMDQIFEVEIEDASEQYSILDFSGNKLIHPFRNGNKLRFRIGPGDNRQIALVKEGVVKPVQTIQSVKFNNYLEDTGADYVIITSSKLFDDGKGNNYVQEYANYRSAEVGGGFNVIVVDVNDLYDQYFYGVARHPYAIKNFVNLIARTFINPQYVLLLGKGRSLHEIRYHNTLSQARNSTFYIPSFGVPASDNLMMSASNTSPTPVIPFGRIAAGEPDQIKLYLDKVKAYEKERNDPADLNGTGWKKNMLHLAGGSPSDHALLKDYLLSLEELIEASEVGANVSMISKESSEPVQTSLSQSVFNKINAGLKVLTFFGHSGGNNLDFDIDIPHKYENYSRFPFLFALGCKTGNMNTRGISVNEHYVFMDSVGFIGSAASVDLSYASSLNSMITAIYSALGEARQEKGIGDIFKMALQELENRDLTNLSRQARQFLLHCDPAIKIFDIPGPDLWTDPTSVSIEESKINTSTDSITLSFDLMNLGTYVDELISLELKRVFPDGEERSLLVDTVEVPYYKTALSYKLPVSNNSSKSVGLNRLIIELDGTQSIAEYPDPKAEDNNMLMINGQPGFPFVVRSLTAAPVFPENYAIVTQDTITFYATSSDLANDINEFEFQLDTVATFDSPWAESSGILSSENGIGSWSPQLSYVKDRVYYWRVRQVTGQPVQQSDWSNRSFLYTTDHLEGWNQSHHFQWAENPGGNLEYDSLNRDFKFVNTESSLHIENQYVAGNGWNRFTLDGELFGYYLSTRMNVGFKVIVIDPLTLNPWFNDVEGRFGSITDAGWTAPARWGSFGFPSEDSLSRSHLIKMLKDSIPDGHIVSVSLHRKSTSFRFDIDPELWLTDSTVLGQNIFGLLESEGSKYIRQLTSTGYRPFVFCYRKGHGPIKETFGDSASAFINFETGISGNWFEGSYLSDIFGPGENIDSLFIDFIANNSIQEEKKIKLYASNSRNLLDNPDNAKKYDQHPEDALVFKEYELEKQRSTLDISDIDRSFIRLAYVNIDTLERDPNDLNYWQLIGHKLPDLVITLKRTAEKRISGDRGETLNYPLQVSNLSTRNIRDSFIITAVFRNVDDNASYNIEKRIAGLDAFESKLINISFPSSKLPAGLKEATFTVNQNEHINESNYTNNLLTFDILTLADNSNPLLDVTFDGRLLRDLEAVSSNPEILISVSDENTYFPLESSDVIEASLIFPDGSEMRLTEELEDVMFTPGNPVENTARLYYRPTLKQFGIYKLTANASDQSGNNASTSEYSIRFQLLQEQEITNFKVFPNPFSEQVQFIYDAQGSDAIDDYELNIYNSTGQLIFSLNENDNGALPIGNNRILTNWYGQTFQGSDAAPGVYLYQFRAFDGEGKEIHFRTSQDAQSTSAAAQGLLVRY